MVNKQNYQFAREYLDYLSEVTQLDACSVDRYWFYLKHLLLWADEIFLSQVPNLRPTFPAYLTTARPASVDGPLAASTLKKIIQTVKRFLFWLKITYAREFRELSPAWIDALRPPRSVESPAEHEFITLDEVQRIIALPIDEHDLALRRDQAAAALLFLSGARASAFSTLPISAVDLPNRTIKQWPSLEVHTKNGKSATTYLLDIPELFTIVKCWDSWVRSQLPMTAMWYTPIISQWGEQTLSADRPGANRNVAIAKRLRLLFARAGLAYKSPHKFRHGHAVYALQHAKTMADYKAVSMNLMHEDIRVTDSIYAPLAGHEVQQRIAGLTNSAVALPADSTDLNIMVRTLSRGQLSEALIAIAQQMARA
jgi:integrase